MADAVGLGAAGDTRDHHSLIGRPSSDHHPYWDAITAIEFLPEPGVFPGWPGIGPPELTTELVRARLDAYAVAIAGRC